MKKIATIYLTPLIPLSFKGEGELVLKEGLIASLYNLSWSPLVVGAYLIGVSKRGEASLA